MCLHAIRSSISLHAFSVHQLIYKRGMEMHKIVDDYYTNLLNREKVRARKRARSDINESFHTLYNILSALGVCVLLMLVATTVFAYIIGFTYIILGGIIPLPSILFALIISAVITFITGKYTVV